MQCESRFFSIYDRVPEGLSFAPYRICPIGAHSDHNLGKITGFAIDKGIHIACRPKQNGVVEMPGRRYDIGDLASYRKVQESYRGIV